MYSIRKYFDENGTEFVFNADLEEAIDDIVGMARNLNALVNILDDMNNYNLNYISNSLAKIAYNAKGKE